MLKRALFQSLAFSALIAAAVWLSRSPHKPLHSGRGRRPTLAAFRLPAWFEPNRGQAGPEVSHVARGRGYSLLLSSSGIAFGGTPVRLRLIGANPGARIEGLDPLAGKTNYLIGNDRAGWVRGVPHYGRVRTRQVYPGVDVVWYTQEGRLEYDFLVAPGAAPGVIRIAFDGAERSRLDAAGDLLLHTARGEVRQRRPRILQNGRELAGRYRLRGAHEVSFEVEGYDPRAELLIDPVLSYSTYLGGSGSDEAYGIAVDALGSAYVTGVAGTTNFSASAASVNPIGRGGPSDAFVAKLSPTGTLVYLTYLGGGAILGSGGEDEGRAIQVDAQGNAWVAGRTTSTNFPVTGAAFQRTFMGRWDAFVAQLDPTGANLLYSTYLGGYTTDEARGLALTPAGDVYVAGWTDSWDSFPTTPGALQRTMAGCQDAFVTKLNRAGAVVYSTYFGGYYCDQAADLAVDQEGNAYITGYTHSADLPVKDAVQSTHGGYFAYKSVDAGANWTGMKLPEKVHLTTLAVDPANPSNVYAGTTGGVFRSSDGGDTWVAARTGLAALYIDSLAIDPRDPATLYAGTEAGGVFKSTDRGARWTAINAGLEYTYVRALAFDSGDSSRIYAGANGAFYLSTDGGARWNQLSSGPDFARLVPDPKTPLTLYAGTHNQGLVKSTDGGKNWVAINPPGTSPCCPGIAPDPQNPATVYLGVPGTANYKSTDGGRNWTQLGGGFPQNCGSNWIAVDPTNPSTVYGAGCGFYKSTDRGSTWQSSVAGMESADTYYVILNPVNPTILYCVSGPPRDAFVAKLDPTGALVYSTYLGGSAQEEGRGVAVDASGSAYVTGYTRSKEFVTTSGAFQTARSEYSDLFLTKLSPRGAMVYSTLLGGRSDEEATDVLVMPSGEAVVAGWSYGNIPASPDAVQRGNRGGRDAVVAVFSASGDKLQHFTYLGGSRDDQPAGIAADAFGNLYLAGRATSDNFPTASPAQATYGGANDAFVAKLSEVLEPMELALVTPVALPAAVAGTSYLATLTVQGGKPPYRWGIDSGALPPGLSLDAAIGVLSGTPTTPGNYSFTARVTDGAQTYAWRSFTLTVNVPPKLTITTGTPLPAGGVGTAYSFTLTAAGGTPPYEWELAGGSLPPGLSLNRVTGQISGTPSTVGSYPFKVRVTDKASGIHTKDVTLAVTPPVSISGVVNGASWVSGAVAPGEIVTLTGAGLGPATLVNLQILEGQLTTTLADTQVLFDNIAAPLLYVQAGQASAIVPYAVAGTKETRVEVQYKGARSSAMKVAVAASAPGIFTVDSTGRGAGAILNQDYTLNSALNPAERGSIVLIYGTGEGETDPQVADGRLATVEALPKPKLPVTVKIGGVEAEVLYAGAVPGMVTGLLQVNARVPISAPSGPAVPVVLTIGAASSPAGVTMAVK